MRTLVLFAVVLVLALGAPRAAAVTPQPALGPGFYDQDNPLIVFGGGTWTTFSGAGYGGTNIASGQVSHTDHYILFSVWGDGIGFYTNMNTNGGVQSICIYSHNTEDEICTTFNTWSATSLTSQRIEVSGFGPGIHTVTIRKATTATYNLNMDALHVLPPVPEPLDPNAITVEVEIGEIPPPAWIALLESDERTAAFDYSVTAGDVGLGILLMGVFVVLLIIVLLKIREDQ